MNKSKISDLEHALDVCRVVTSDVVFAVIFLAHVIASYSYLTLRMKDFEGILDHEVCISITVCRIIF